MHVFLVSEQPEFRSDRSFIDEACYLREGMDSHAGIFGLSASFSDCRLAGYFEARRIRTHAEECERIGSLRPATQLRRTAARRQNQVHSIFGRITPCIRIASNDSGKGHKHQDFLLGTPATCRHTERLVVHSQLDAKTSTRTNDSASDSIRHGCCRGDKALRAAGPRMSASQPQNGSGHARSRKKQHNV